MTHSPPQVSPSTERAAPLIVDVYIALIAAAAVACTALVAWLEVRSEHGDVNWSLFVALSALLIFTESRPSSVMRFGAAGMVTPSWAFAFALLLLGAPTAAIGVMAAATGLAEIIPRRPVRKLFFNVGQVTLSLALGSLTLAAFDVHDPFFNNGEIPLKVGVSMVLSGTVVFFTNGAVTGRLLSFLEGQSFLKVMRQGLVLSMSADGAMLALAPMLVVSLEASLLMLPLLATTAYLVFQTARQALRRAHEADHDPLTQLLNRRSFTQELDSYLVTGERTTPGAVFILDLDRFKEINDRLGHRTGDAVLQRFSERLVDTLPDRSVVARLGGDEFGVLLPHTDAATAMNLAHSIIEAFDEPMNIEGFPLSINTSIGVALTPDHGADPSELMHAADVAMYRAKRYRSGVECYQAFGSSKERGRVTLLADIADGFERDEFFVEYQPQIEMATGRVEAVEALLRWNHARLGRVGPAEFVGLAEHTDLIEPLTKFVLRQAVADVGQLDDTTRVAVNVSARNLQSRHFADDVIAILAEADFPSHRLELEITESAVANEPERTAVTLDQLRSAGVSIAIDDFGTGYASFGMLREIRVDRIKIDRSFTTALETSDADEQIVASIIEMAHRLGLGVVAEGVERAETWRVLEAHGCDIAQGFLMSKPGPIESMATLIATDWKYPAPLTISAPSTAPSTARQRVAPASIAAEALSA